MHENGLKPATRKGERKHQSVVNAKTTHIKIAIEGTLAMVEILISDEQATVFFLDVFDNILVSSVIQKVYDGIAVAGVESFDWLALLLWTRSQVIVDDQLEERIVVAYPVYLEWYQ